MTNSETYFYTVGEDKQRDRTSSATQLLSDLDGIHLPDETPMGRKNIGLEIQHTKTKQIYSTDYSREHLT